MHKLSSTFVIAFMGVDGSGKSTLIKKLNKRLKKRYKGSLKIIKRFKKVQLPVEFKRKKSQFIIKNNFKTNSIKKNVKMILKKINI